MIVGIIVCCSACCGRPGNGGSSNGRPAADGGCRTWILRGAIVAVIGAVMLFSRGGSVEPDHWRFRRRRPGAAAWRRRMKALSLAIAVALASAACATVPPAASAQSISYETGPCFGACPVFRVTVSPDGSGTFEGRRFTAVDRRTRLPRHARAVSRLRRTSWRRCARRAARCDTSGDACRDDGDRHAVGRSDLALRCGEQQPLFLLWLRHAKKSAGTGDAPAQLNDARRPVASADRVHRNLYSNETDEVSCITFLTRLSADRSEICGVPIQVHGDGSTSASTWIQPIGLLINDRD